MRTPTFLPVMLVLSLAGPAFAQDPCADYVPQPKPQNVGRDIVGKDMDTLQEQGFMSFAVYRDLPPYSWEEDGAPRGVDIEIARLVAGNLGVDARFNFVTAGENLEADLRNNIWQGSVIERTVSNVMMRVPYNSAFTCRVEQVVFTGLYARESIGIAYDEAVFPDDAPTVPYFRFHDIGVETDSISDFYLTSFARGQIASRVRHYPRMPQAMKALADGEVTATMGPMAQLEWGLTDGVAVHSPPLAGFAVSKWNLGVAVHFAYRPLSYAVDDAITAAMQDGRIAAIYADYGLSFEPPQW